MQLAIFSGKVEIVRLLTRSGANLDHLDIDGRNLADYLIGVRTNNQIFCEILEVLVGIGFVDFGNHETECQIVPMAAWAFAECSTETADLLIKYGALKGSYDRGSKNAPVQVAIGQGNLDALRILVHHKNDFHHGSALDMAVECRQIKALKMLISSGINMNQLNLRGNSSAMHRSAKDDPLMLKKLLEKGANPNIRDDCDGSTPLHSAARHYATQCMALLLEHGADINAKDHLGKAPAHVAVALAISHHGGKSVLWLIKNRANILITDNEDRSPLHDLVIEAAAFSWKWCHGRQERYLENFSQCLEVLLQYGADPQESCPELGTTKFIPMIKSYQTTAPSRTSIEEVLAINPRARRTFIDKVLGGFGDAVSFVDDRLYWVPSGKDSKPAYRTSAVTNLDRSIGNDATFKSHETRLYRDPTVFELGWMMKYTHLWHEDQGHSSGKNYLLEPICLHTHVKLANTFIDEVVSRIKRGQDLPDPWRQLITQYSINQVSNPPYPKWLIQVVNDLETYVWKT